MPPKTFLALMLGTLVLAAATVFGVAAILPDAMRPESWSWIALGAAVLAVIWHLLVRRHR